MSANPFLTKVVYTLGDDVSTDAVYPGRYMATVLPAETPRYAFADHAELNRRLLAGEVPPGSAIVAGANFGCGSSREQAASCLKWYDLILIARSFARIFLQNSVNLGLRTLVCPTIRASEGDQLEVAEDYVLNRATGVRYPQEPLPEAQRAIVAAGGLIPFTRMRLMKKHNMV